MHNNDFTENSMEDNESYTNKDKFEFVLACIPFVNFSLIFSKTQKNNKTKKYIEQSYALFVFSFLLSILLGVIHLGGLVSFAYVVFVIFITFKAYEGVYIQIDFLDKLIDLYNKTKLK